MEARMSNKTSSRTSNFSRRLAIAMLSASSIAFAEEITPTQPSPERLLEIPAEALASGIRHVADAQLPFMKLVRQGMKSYNFNELDKPVVVDLQNVEFWERTFIQRLDLYTAAAKTRGSKSIAGVYNIKFEHPDCGTLPPRENKIEITQNDNSFIFVLKKKINGVGTIVEEAIILNMGNTIGTVPYWKGNANPSHIALSDSASNCRILLFKE
jgi:hypothetical protein